MQKCHRCKNKFETSTSWFMDYCAMCSRNLCDDCMLGGCCGSTPARSGRRADADDADMQTERSYQGNLLNGNRPRISSLTEF